MHGFHQVEVADLLKSFQEKVSIDLCYTQMQLDSFLFFCLLCFNLILKLFEFSEEVN